MPQRSFLQMLRAAQRYSRGSSNNVVLASSSGFSQYSSLSCIRSPLTAEMHTYRPIGVKRIRPGRYSCFPKDFLSQGLLGHRTYSSPASNAFWRDLSLAVKEGDAEQAEAIVTGLLKTYTDDPLSSSSSFDTRIFSLVLEAWKNSEDELAADRSQQLLDQMIALSEEGTLREPPSLDDYHSVLECWVASGDSSLQAAESVLRITKQLLESYEPMDHTFDMVLEVLANGGHVTSIIKFIRSTIPKPYSVRQCNFVLQAFSNSTHPEAAKRAQLFLEEMKDEASVYPSPDINSFNLVLQCWSKNPTNAEALTSAQQLLAEMSSLNLQPTLNSYHPVISVLAEHGEAELAEHLLRRLVNDYGVQFDAQLKPTIAPFETVLWSYTKSFRIDAASRAEALLNHMQELFEDGILDRNPDAWSYNFVLKCWMHSRQADASDRAVKLLQQMQAKSIKPDISTLNTVLNSIAKRGDPWKAEEFLNNMYQGYLEDPIQNPQPDKISFGTVMKAWSMKKHPHGVERIEELFSRLQNLDESGWSNCKPDQAIFSCIIKTYANSTMRDSAQKAELMLKSMQDSSHDDSTMEPDTVCWNMTIQAWAKAGNGKRAEGLFIEMLQKYLDEKDTNAAPNQITFSAVLSAWAKTQNDSQAASRAEKLLQQMKKLASTETLPDCKPNVIHYSIVLDALAYSKSAAGAQRAESILREMRASDDPDIQPNVVSYNSVIKAWSLSREPSALYNVTTLIKEMVHLFEECGNKNVKPNANTFGSALKVIADSDVKDKQNRAQIIVDLMKKFGAGLNDWSRTQLRRCSDSGGKKQQQRRRRPKKSVELPGIPDLKYT